MYRNLDTSPVKVGIREFREQLARYLLTSVGPLAITRHGDTIGYYIPMRRKRTEAERAALEGAEAKVQAMMSDIGITEDEVIEDFKRWRANRRK